MKKFILSLVIAMFAVVNVNAQNDNLIKITSDYQKMVDIGAAMFRFNDLSFATDGLCYIKFKDFKSAGNLITIQYKLNEFNDGKEIIKKFEDVLFLKDNESGAFVVINKYKETILILLPYKNDKYAFCIEDKMMLISD